MQPTATGMSFGLTSPEGSISIETDEVADTFTLEESFIVDFINMGGIDGAFYRVFETAEFDGTVNYHEEFVLRAYQAYIDTVPDPDEWAPGALIAVDGEVFKTNTVYGVLIKRLVSQDPGTPNPANPHESGFDTSIVDLWAPSFPSNDGENDEFGTVYKEYMLWIYDDGVYAYKVSDAPAENTGLFRDTDNGDDSTPHPGSPNGIYHNKDGVELISALAFYGWTMIP
jgi:hypothetical protein